LAKFQFNRCAAAKNHDRYTHFVFLVVDFFNRAIEVGERAVFDANEFADHELDFVTRLVHTVLHLAEGKFLFYFLAYCNESDMSPFVFMDKVYSKETKYKLSRTLPIKFKLPVFDGHRDYRDLGLGTKDNWLDWKFKNFIIYDGVKLKFKGSASTQFLEPNTEVTVRYDASNKSIKRRSQNSAFTDEKINQDDGLQKLINAAHIVSGYPKEANTNNKNIKNNKSRNKKGTPEIKYYIIIIIIVVLPYNC